MKPEIQIVDRGRGLQLSTSRITVQDLVPYFPTKSMPVCPAGGVYTLNPVGLAPICSVPGHVLPK